VCSTAARDHLGRFDLVDHRKVSFFKFVLAFSQFWDNKTQRGGFEQDEIFYFPSKYSIFQRELDFPMTRTKVVEKIFFNISS